MRKKIKTLISYLASFIFEDVEYKKLMSYITLKQEHKAITLVDEKIGYLEATKVLYREDSVLEYQIQQCIKLKEVIEKVQLQSLVEE